MFDQRKMNMVDKTSTALLAALFSVAAGVGMTFAQEAGGTTEAPAAPAAETAAPAAPAAEAPAAPAAAAEAPAAAPAQAPAAGTAPAAPANGEPQPGQAYIRETFGDWSMRCIKTAENRDPCELYQLLKDADGGAVAEASVIPVDVEGEVKAIVTFVAPLETDLQHGLRLQIDTNQPTGYPFMVCAQIGCISRVGLNEEQLSTFKRGNAGSATLQPFGVSPERAVKLTMPLKGFTAGLDAVTKALKEVEAAAPAPAAPAAAPASGAPAAAPAQ